jgi:hypothetical protein
LFKNSVTTLDIIITSDEKSTMAARKEIIAKVQKMVPPMLESFHKGKTQNYILVERC